MPILRIVEFSDPACPFAFSAEPLRWRLRWTYGEQIEWDLRLVGLAASAQEYLDRGFDTARQAEAFADFAERYGMPIDSRERPRQAATVPACRAVVAVRRHRPELARQALREIAIAQFAGGLLDDPELIAGAVARAGVTRDELERWTAEAETEERLAADLAEARRPSPEALAQPDRLARWSEGWRYTCPSYEITRLADERRLSAPGFQPLAAYELAMANLMPSALRRPAPEDPLEALAWAEVPLATAELAAITARPRAWVAQSLEGRAHRRAVGDEAYWSPAG